MRKVRVFAQVLFLILIVVLLLSTDWVQGWKGSIPDPVYIQLEPGQQAWLLCPTGQYYVEYGKESGMVQCRANPATR